MVFVREIKRGNKVYRYKYKSKRVDGKVKSIYLGKELVSGSKKKTHKKTTKKKVVKKTRKRSTKSRAKSKPKVHKKVMHRSDQWIIDRIVDFNQLVEETKLLVIKNKLEAAVNHYNKLLDLYNSLSEQVTEDHRIELYYKTKEVYESISKINY